MSGHRHAALMAEYARIAQQYEEPWEFFEWLPDDGKWKGLSGHPSWDIYTEYRLKPHTIRIGEIDVPEPMRSAPKDGDVYFVASPIGCFSSKWDGTHIDLYRLGLGLCHTTVEAAAAHVKALILVSGGKV